MVSLCVFIVAGFAMKRETYAQARTRLLSELTIAGWTVKASLKVPQAIPPHGDFTLFFKSQAVYLNSHSLWIDIRGMSVNDFIDRCFARL